MMPLGGMPTPVGPGITIGLTVYGWEGFLWSASRWVGLHLRCREWVYRRVIRHYFPAGLPPRPVYFTVNGGRPVRILDPAGGFENV